MFGYYFILALRSLRRTPALTALMILAIGVGIGASMTTLAMFRTAAADPIPGKSAELFTPQIDNCGSGCTFFQARPPSDRMPLLLSYRDAVGLLQLPTHDTQAAMYATGVTVIPPDPRSHPLQAAARVTGAGFFPMFQVPFEYGAPWGRREDDAHAAVVVITRALNDELFDGTNSVGRTLRLDDDDYRIIGVTDHWEPVPRFYDLLSRPLGDSDALFIPFTKAVDIHLQPAGYMVCSGGPTRPARDAWDGLIESDQCNWVDFWVELPSAAALQRYRQMLAAYANDQRRDGRFPWLPRVQLRDVTQWLRYLDVVPAEVRVAVMVSFGLLAACLINAMGLILARFLPRTLDISVRRATGATRPAIFLQNLIELGLIGVLGAGLGLLLTALGLQVSRRLLPVNLLALVRFDAADAGIAFALSIAAALIAGLYPIWRMSRVQPAFQLKVQ